MDFDKIPVWAYGVGGVVVIYALLSRDGGGAAPVVTNIGAQPNAYATQRLSVAQSGFDTLTGFASGVVQTDAAKTTSLAGINAQTAVSLAQSRNDVSTAEINAETERARIAAAARTTDIQGANSLAATRTQAKASTTNSIIDTAGKVIGGIAHFFGF